MQTVPKVLLIIDFSEEYGRGLLRGIIKYSQLFGPWSFTRMPPLFGGENKIQTILKWAVEWGADGIIGQLQSNEDLIELKKAKLPIISLDVNERYENIPNITGQYKRTGEMAAAYFIQHGFTKFAFYGFNKLVWSRERLDGYEKYLTNYNYKVEIYEHKNNEKPELWSYDALPLFKWLEELPKPIAMMTCDDNQALHISEACRIAGIGIPEQIAIIGVDNDEVICNLAEPPLSSIGLNTEKAGFEAADLLARMMRNEVTNIQDIIVEPLHIVVRRSSDIFAIEDKELAKALWFINYNFKESIQVEDVVKATSLSRRVLEKRFMKIIGKSIMNSVNELRIEQVRKMLLNTNLTINEIAYSCGYTDVKNLARFFKRKQNETPLAYRKMRISKT